VRGAVALARAAQENVDDVRGLLDFADAVVIAGETLCVMPAR